MGRRLPVHRTYRYWYFVRWKPQLRREQKVSPIFEVAISKLASKAVRSSIPSPFEALFQLYWLYFQIYVVITSIP